MSRNTLRKNFIAYAILAFFICSCFQPGIGKINQSKEPIKITIGTTELGSISDVLDPAFIFNQFSIPLSSNKVQFFFYTFLSSVYPSERTILKIENLAYEGLVTYDQSNPNLIKGVLADSWTISPNGTVYTFNLKHNIRFTDGTPFNAYVMKYSIDRMIIINYQGVKELEKYIVGASDIYSNDYLNMTQVNKYLSAGGVIAKDEYTLQIKLIKPYEPFLSLLTLMPKAVSPYSIIKNRPNTYDTNQSDFYYGMVSLQNMFPTLSDWTKLGLEKNHDPAISGIVPQTDPTTLNANFWMLNHMVGTGPYILMNNSKITLSFVKNQNWHDNASFTSNSPDQIIWEDGTISTFESGNFDILDAFDINPQDANIPNIQLYDSIIDKNGLSKINDATIYYIPSLINVRFAFNLKDNLAAPYVSPASDISMTWNLTHIKNDKILRYSTNDTYFASINNPFTSLEFREAFAYAFDYNQLIATVYHNYLGIRSQGEIPYGITGYQGKEIATGITPSFNLTKAKELFQDVGWRGTITFPDGSKTLGTRQVVDKLLANAINSLNIGITINQEGVSDRYYNAHYSNTPGDVFGWGMDFNDAYSYLYSQLDSQGSNSQLLTHYANPSVDKLISQSENEPNLTTRLNLFKQIEEISAHDYPALNLVNPVIFYITWNSIQNVTESGSLNPLLYSFNFQYMSKIPLPAKSNAIPGFDIIPMIALLVLLPFIRKNLKKIKK